ncbi:MAG: hypothetical protein AAB250_04940, partial [Bdellovibrionota bacterium]
PETLNISYHDFFKLLATTDHSDRGTIERLRRRFKNQAAVISKAEIGRIVKLVRAQPQVISRHGDTRHNEVVLEWLRSPYNEKNPAVAKDLLARSIDPGSFVWHLIESDGNSDRMRDVLDEYVRLNDVGMRMALRNLVFSANRHDDLWSHDPRAPRWVELLYPPEVIDKMAKVGFLHILLDSSLIWLRPGTSGKTLLELHLESPDSLYRPNGKLAMIKELEPVLRERVFGVFKAKVVANVRSIGTSDLISTLEFEATIGSAKSFAELLGQLEMLRSDLETEKARELVTHLFETRFKTPAERKVVAEVLMQGDWKERHVDDLVENILQKYSPELLPGYLKFVLRLSMLTNGVVELLASTSDPELRALRPKAISAFESLSYPRVTAAKMRALILNHYRDDHRNWTEDVHDRFAYDLLRSERLVDIGVELLVQEGPQVWAKMLSRYLRFLPKPAHHNRAKVEHQPDVVEALLKSEKWKKSDWLLEFIPSQAAEIRRSYRFGLGTTTAIVEPFENIISKFGPGLRGTDWREHLEVLRELVGLSSKIDVFVLEQIFSDPKMIREYGDVIDKIIEVRGQEYLTYDYRELPAAMLKVVGRPEAGARRGERERHRR